MFEAFSRGFNSTVYYHTLDQSSELDSKFFYEDNIAVQDFIGLMMDLYGATDHINNEIRGLRSAEDSLLFLMMVQGIAEKLMDEGFQTRLKEWAMDEDGEELLQCMASARELTKKQMLEMIPRVCSIAQQFLRIRGAFECVDELLREIDEQNTKLAYVVDQTTCQEPQDETGPQKAPEEQIAEENNGAPAACQYLP